jgi:hypothetical protein
MELKPQSGGFQGQIRTADFILRSLMGKGPEGSRKFNPIIGAPMTDIFFEYKNALHRLYARNAVEAEEEKRIKHGKPAYTEEEYNERLNHFLSKIPHKLYKMRYSSFTRYFGHLVRLDWVEKQGLRSHQLFKIVILRRRPGYTIE